ncbi:hypothetical protein VQ042_20625 [Aurantimonas sp. A2-1-M11]|uniref:hypothetical protein n=1 Tax=Aurantimonas sp. A2-1-M11 TaxID=3113712 RepID=UPI002F9537E4
MGRILEVKDQAVGGRAHQEFKLLAVCREYQGEYCGAGHPATSYSTTYGDEFVRAAVELYQIYVADTRRSPEAAMAMAFQRAEVRSCRGQTITIERVRYLIRRRILPFLDGRDSAIPGTPS